MYYILLVRYFVELQSLFCHIEDERIWEVLPWISRRCVPQVSKLFLQWLSWNHNVSLSISCLKGVAKSLGQGYNLWCCGYLERRSRSGGRGCGRRACFILGKLTLNSPPFKYRQTDQTDFLFLDFVEMRYFGDSEEVKITVGNTDNYRHDATKRTSVWDWLCSYFLRSQSGRQHKMAMYTLSKYKPPPGKPSEKGSFTKYKPRGLFSADYGILRYTLNLLMTVEVKRYGYFLC